LVLGESAGFVAEQVLDLAHFFVHGEVLHFDLASVFWVHEMGVLLDEGGVVDLDHLQDDDQFEGNELVEQQVVTPKGLEAQVIRGLLENILRRVLELLDEQKCLGGHDTSEHEDQSHVPEGDKVDGSVELGLVEDVLAVVHYDLGVGASVDHHRICEVGVLQHRASIEELLQIHWQMLVSILH
jgi:hypothetical protein